MGKRSQVIYADRLRWEPLKVRNSNYEGRAWIKTFNLDRETGARSALVRYDPGFSQEESTSEWPIDSFVLEGAMTCGDLNFRKGSYHYRPAGARFGPVETTEGIIRLVFAGDDGKGSSAGEPVFVEDVNRLPFEPSYNNPSGLDKGGIRVLRQDQEAGVSVLINYTFKPDRLLDGKAEVHDHFEEAYQFIGESEDWLAEVDGHIVWIPGIYIYREPFTAWHGDVVKYGLPKGVFIKRGWVGEMTRFWDKSWAKDRTMAVGTVEFSD
jgi:hypothetical protein